MSTARLLGYLGNSDWIFSLSGSLRIGIRFGATDVVSFGWHKSIIPGFAVGSKQYAVASRRARVVSLFSAYFVLPTAYLSDSTVQLGRDDVQTSQDGNDVGEQVVLDDVREHGKMDERWWTGPNSPGGLAAVGHQVIAEFAVGAFDCGVNLLARRFSNPRLGMISSKC